MYAGPEEMPLCHYRLQGYVQALRRCGIMVDPQYVAVATSPSKPEAKQCNSCLISHNRLLLSSAIAM